MKKIENEKISKFQNNFEIGKNKQLNVYGGTEVPNLITAYTIPGSQASSYACPDTKQDLSY